MKKRLDELLLASGLADNLIQARALIGAGQVLVNEQLMDKAGCLVASDVRLQVKPRKADLMPLGMILVGRYVLTSAPHQVDLPTVCSSTGQARSMPSMSPMVS